MADVTALFPVFIDTDDNGTNPMVQAETDNICRYLMQVVFQEREMPRLPDDLQVLHVSQVGRIHTLIVRGRATEVTNRLAVYAPILMEALPLTLEEIFIYELGGEDYAVRDIVL